MKSRINKLEYTYNLRYKIEYYYKNKKRHRDGDLPAAIFKSGTRIWYKDGLEHRDNNKPTMISDGKMYWYKDDMYIKDTCNEIENK